MKKNILKFSLLIFSSFAFSQAGHIMQGVGAFNMSMGGASTGQPLDISGALQWNPASISAFDGKIIKLDLGLFYSSPELSSSLPAGMMGTGSPAVSGVTKDARGVSPMPALAFVYGKEGSKHTFGVSAFGISGFGVTFPEEANNPMSATFDPTKNSNPINYPQQAGGFGKIESDYMLLQVGFTWAYKLTDKIAFGVEPTFNYGTLQLMPNPTADPSMTAGYPSTDKASTSGFGGQVGLFYDSKAGFKAGVSYKTTQNMNKFEFKNTYLDNTTSTSNFDMDYPSILSLGLGYSEGDFDAALDYRFVDYKNTNGFSETGWTPTGSVKGFGWNNVSIVSAGLQYKGIKKLPLRLGYTYSSNPIGYDNTFFNIPATAIIKNAMQFGFSYPVGSHFTFDAVYHHGSSDGKTFGPMLNPMAATSTNPNGAIPLTNVAYSMTTDMVMAGLTYKFSK